MKTNRLPLLVSILGAAGCGPQNYLEPAGPAAHEVARLGWFVLILFAQISLVVWAVIGWAALRKRGRLDEHAPVDIASGQDWVVFGGFVLPAITLAVVFFTTLRTMAAFPLHQERYRDDAIRIIGHQWWFDVQYQFDKPELNVTSPSEVHIPIRSPMDLELTSRDVIHSFWVPRLHGKVDLIPGMMNQMHIAADKPGVYEGECAEFCGEQHTHMRIQVIAHTPQQYQAWLEAQRMPAAEPATPEAQRGRDLFQAAACPLCHTVRGTPAGGLVGPDLTHVASRHRIAGDSLRNSTANLEAWVTHAQSLKPGSQMPNLTQFTGEELRAIVAYLQGLR